MAKFLLLAFAVIGILSSCDSSPMPEFNIIGEIPINQDFDRASLLMFVDKLASHHNLRVNYQSSADGGLAAEGEFWATLKPENGERIVISVMARLPKRYLSVSVTNDINPARAEIIISQATELIQEVYHGAVVRRFERKRGLLGP